jgi:hypothetical protein
MAVMYCSTELNIRNDPIMFKSLLAEYDKILNVFQMLFFNNITGSY